MKIKQNSIKKPNIYHISWKEFVLKRGKTEDQESPGNLPNIGKLFDYVVHRKRTDLLNIYAFTYL